MTCKQLSKVSLKYDDAVYRFKPLSKFIVAGKVLSFQKDTSPRGMAVLNIRLEDSTGICRIMVYFKEDYEPLCKEKGYVKIAATAKSAGLVYRP